LSDYVLSFTLLPFTVAQLGRHTGDYDNFRYYCFSANGLGRDFALSGTTLYTPPSNGDNLA